MTIRPSLAAHEGNPSSLRRGRSDEREGRMVGGRRGARRIAAHGAGLVTLASRAPCPLMAGQRGLAFDARGRVDEVMGRKSETEVRLALIALKKDVARGVEYPDAEERASRWYRLTDAEVRALRTAYDADCGGGGSS
jgi:hypothetical protein